MPCRGKVRAHLVPYAGAHGGQHEGPLFCALEHLDEGFRRLSLPGARGSDGARRAADQGPVGAKRASNAAADQAEILLASPAATERLPQPGVLAGVACGDEDAGGVAVEAMDEAAFFGAAAHPLEVGVERAQGLRHASGRAAAFAVQAGRLLEHHPAVVLEHDPQGELRFRGVFSRRIGGLDLHLAPGPGLVGRAGDASVDAHEAVLEPAPNDPASLAARVGDEPVGASTAARHDEAQGVAAHDPDARRREAGRQSAGGLLFGRWTVRIGGSLATPAKSLRRSSRAERSRGVERRRRFAVVMAGGSGTRFWPWSREDLPKQLLALASPRSMLADTVARLDGWVPPENILVVVGRRHRRAVRAALPGLPSSSILCEPTGRNTAACIAWATREILARCEDGVSVVLSADHLIRDDGAFRRDMERAFAVADRTRRLVTFGIRPSAPSTGFGYVRAGAVLRGASPAMEVAAFVEKPNLAKARRYVASGDYFWNAGIFAWRADVLWTEVESHLPSRAAGLLELVKARRRGALPNSALDRVYPGLPSISIDYGVLERSRHVAMLPASFGWADIGSWDAMASLWPADAGGNVSRDPVLALDSSGNLVATRGKPVALLGVKGLVVVDAGDALLVCARDRCQDVRAITAALEKAGLGRLR
jgi:mannose-1-phosphate guanylyltransferase